MLERIAGIAPKAIQSVNPFMQDLEKIASRVDIIDLSSNEYLKREPLLFLGDRKDVGAEAIRLWIFKLGNSPDCVLKVIRWKNGSYQLEVARLGWSSYEIYLDGLSICIFPAVNSFQSVSPGHWAMELK